MPGTKRKQSAVPKKTAKKKTKTAVKRTVKKAAANVHGNAERARDLAAALIRAAEMIEQGAGFLDSMAGRAEKAVARKGSRSRTKD